MNHAIAIAGRELRDRSRLFILAAALAVIPFIAAMLPGARGNRPDVIALGGAILAVALGVGSALTLGSTIIGRELSERRLSFYFSKPVSPAALWIGKAAAALLASLACFFIIVLPAFLSVGRAWSAGVVGMKGIVIAGVMSIVILFFASHTVSSMVRSRSAVLAVDLLLAGMAVAAVYLILRTVAMNGAEQQMGAILAAVAGAVLLVLMVAPVWQLRNGRTDVRRSHAALSRALWTAVAAIVAAAGAYTAWLVSVDLDDIAEVQLIERAPAGHWALIGGAMEHRPGYYGTFLVNSATGASVRMPSPLWWGATFSRDGRTLAWLQPDGVFRHQGLSLRTRRLDAADAQTVDTGIRSTSNTFALSHDGSRVAIANDRNVTVYELPEGKILASAALGGPSSRSLFFVTPEVVRVLDRGRTEGVPLRIYELNVAARSLAQTGENAGGATFLLSASADGTRVLPRREVVIDGRTGATLFTLPEWNATDVRPRMLHDGSVARVGYTGGRVHLQLFDRGGALRHDVVLPEIRNALVSGDTTDGKVLVLGSRVWGKDRTTFVVDKKSGAVHRAPAAVRGPWPVWWDSDPRVLPFGREILVTSAEGEVMVWSGGAEVRPFLR